MMTTRHKNLLFVGLAGVAGSMLADWLTHNPTWKIMANLVWLPILFAAQVVYDEVLNLKEDMYKKRRRTVGGAAISFAISLAMVPIAQGAKLNMCGYSGPGFNLISLWFYGAAAATILTSWQLGYTLGDKYRRPWLRAITILMGGAATIGLMRLHGKAPYPLQFGWWLEIAGAALILIYCLMAGWNLREPSEDSLPHIRLDITKALCLIMFGAYVGYFPFAVMSTDPKLAAMPVVLVGASLLGYALSAYHRYRQDWT